LFLPQVLSARYVEALPWKKPWAVRFGALQRCMPLLIALSLLMFGDQAPSTCLLLFFLFYTLNQLLLGVTTPGWFDMLAKMIPTRRRGRLIGIRSSLGGIGAFCCGLVLTWLLANLSFPMNFAAAFGLAFVLQAASVVAQMFLVESEPSPVLPRRPLGPYLRSLLDVWRSDTQFRTFLVAAIFQVLAGIPSGFFTVYALREFNAGETAVGTFTLAMVLSQVVASTAIGYLADRHGNKTSLIIAAAALLCANVWSLLAPSLEWFIVVYLFLGVNLGTELLARYNIAVEYAPSVQRSTYIGFMNTLIAPFYLAGLAAGGLTDFLGYKPVFLMGTLASVVGLWLLTSRVSDPRKHDPTTVGG
ncbi:MAG TPA: MFS transporter, partial [Bacteroidota bacterium]|nr:MFS transporter [Bacteroidota bacterium]